MDWVVEMIDLRAKLSQILSKSDFVSQGIDAAMVAEQEGADLYRHMADRAPHGDEADFFNFLSGQEQFHYRQLAELKKALTASGRFIPLSRPPSSQAAPKIFEKKTAEWNKRVRPPAQEEISPLLQAMDVEKQFRDFYAAISSQIEKTGGDPAGVSFFSGLADWEQAHLDYLNQLFEEITNPDQYVLG